MSNLLNPDQKETTTNQNQHVSDFRSSLLQNFLTGSVILGTVLFIVCLYVFVQTQNVTGVVLSIIVFTLLFCATFLTRLHSQIRVVTLYNVFLITGLLSFYFSGLNANGLIFLFISVLIIGIFGKRSQWVASVVITGVSSLLIGSLIQNRLVNNGNFTIEQNTLFYWVVTFTLLLFLMVLIILPLVQFLRNIENEFIMMTNLKNLSSEENARLNHQVGSLETEITNQRNHLIYTRQILRETASQRNTASIMNELVENLRSNYDLKFVGIYLPVENNEFLELRASSEGPGWIPAYQNNRVRVIEKNIISLVFKKGTAKINPPVDQLSAKIEKELLADSIIELAFPLRLGEKAIGVLYLQVDETITLPSDLQQIFQSISDQTAIILDKSLLIDSMQQSIDELEQSLMQESKSSWQTHLFGSHKKLSYQYSNYELQTKDFVGDDEMFVIKENQNKSVSLEQSKNPSENSALFVPIVVNNNPLGVIRIKTDQPKISREMEDLVDSISHRLSAAIENARLLEEIQERADREKSISDIVRKTRDATDIETILQTTARELGNTLSIDEVHIQLKTQEL